MIETRPYDDHHALHIMRNLDRHDLTEAQLVRGQPAGHLALFADWRAMQGARVVSLVLALDAAHGGAPFAVLALANTGQAGVAQAALLARDHRTFRRALAKSAIMIRQQMPEFCAKAGIHRVEARCWAGHPTAPGFLSAIGFTPEAVLRGFGASGRAEFIQFAWIDPQPDPKGP